jgi:polysaccharide pyruvyl transferase WcaK-like protein
VALAADPAFLLKPEVPADAELPVVESSSGVLGLNLSPFADYKSSHATRAALIEAVRGFVRTVVGELGMSVVLVPHVEPLRNPEQSDRRLLSAIADGLPELEGRIALLRDGLNAAELKYCIGRCRFFIGARTHSTIASLSSSVPTLSRSLRPHAIRYRPKGAEPVGAAICILAVDCRRDIHPAPPRPGAASVAGPCARIPAITQSSRPLR